MQAVCSCGLTQFGETIAPTLSLGVLLLSSHREKALQSKCENCGNIAHRHTGGLVEVMSMLANISTSW